MLLLRQYGLVLCIIMTSEMAFPSKEVQVSQDKNESQSPQEAPASDPTPTPPYKPRVLAELRISQERPNPQATTLVKARNLH
ncbi:hypothetical protein NQZ68_026546 [Dissostichus eleginoides]|nr:hypothetical protein NQZ68_026546 [Dissostichus eleginoides]